MDKLLFFLIFFSCITPVIAQQKLLTHSEILAPGIEKEYLIAVDSGDTIEIQLERQKGSKIPEFSFSRYPNQLIFKESGLKKYNKRIIIPEKGIYRFLLINTKGKPIHYQFDVHSNKVNKRPMKIDYQVKKDTIYAYTTSQLVEVKSEHTEILQNEKFYLNSRSNAFIKGGKERIIFPVNLPKNTIEWFYVFTASRNEYDIKNTLKTFDLAGSLSLFLKEDKSLQSAVANINAPPGADICDIYLLDENNARLFIENDDFKYDLSASRENYKSGIVEVKQGSNQKVFLGINNPDNIYGIHVSFEIIAIVEKKELVTQKVNIPVITSYLHPYIK